MVFKGGYSFKLVISSYNKANIFHEQKNQNHGACMINKTTQIKLKHKTMMSNRTYKDKVIKIYIHT